MNLEIRIIRTIWNLVDTSNPYRLLQLSDRELSQQLIAEIQKVFALNSEDNHNLIKYLNSKTSLIRDLACSKVD